MKQPIYTVTAKMLHENATPVNGTSQTFMEYHEALNYFHELCKRNSINASSWIQEPLQMTASNKDHKIELLIINF